MTRRWWWIVPVVALAACGRQTPVSDTAEPAELPTQAVTRWSERTELFAEHPPLIVGQPARFAIHFTDLRTFKPLTRGRSVVTLTGPRTETFAADGPSRPGIFGVTVTPTAAGRYTMRIEVAGDITDVHDVGTVQVFATEDAARAGTPAGEDEGGISFLKEQQWTLDFATTTATNRPMRAGLEVPGEVRPRTGGDAVVASPISGRVLRISPSATLGAQVPAGAVLAEVLPLSGQANDAATLEAELTQARAHLQLAQAERARVERLSSSGAVPTRRVQESTIAEDSARARVTAAESRLAQLDLARTGRGDAANQSRFQVRAPIAGVVTEAHVTAGVAIEQGAPLFRLVAIDTVHVVANVPEAQVAQLSSAVQAEMMVPSEATPVALGGPLSRGRVLDPATRTLPVVFRLARPPATIAVGQRVSVRLLTGTNANAVAVPETALVDDGGRQVVFVQASGEAFERRPVTPGARDAGFVAVDGVKVGERVVVRGAPLVRLASLSTQVPAHGHVH